MADAKHKVERAAFGAAIDGILKYVNKDEADREKAFLKLVDLSEKFMEMCIRDRGSTMPLWTRAILCIPGISKNLPHICRKKR